MGGLISLTRDEGDDGDADGQEDRQIVRLVTGEQNLTDLESRTANARLCRQTPARHIVTMDGLGLISKSIYVYTCVQEQFNSIARKLEDMCSILFLRYI